MPNTFALATAYTTGPASSIVIGVRFVVGMTVRAMRLVSVCNPNLATPDVLLMRNRFKVAPPHTEPHAAEMIRL